MRHDPVVAVETLGNNLRSLKALLSIAVNATSSTCCTAPAGLCGL